MKKPSISFFCPAYYDEKNLPVLIPKVVKVLKRLSSKFEIYIIEDGSPDKTAEVADALAKKYNQRFSSNKPYIIVVHHPKNLGYGAALRDGYNHAKKYEYTLYTDGDNQFDVEETAKMIPYLSTNDAVIGYRSQRSLTLARQIQTTVYNWLIRLLFGLKVKDINCALKIISKKALNKISLESNSGFIDAELLIKLKNSGARIYEVEVLHYPRKFGKASGGKPHVVIGTFIDMIKFYFKSI